MSAYLIVDAVCYDPEPYERYKELVKPLFEAAGGIYHVRGGNPEIVEGDWNPERIIVMEFPNREAIRKLFDSEEYAPVKALRHASANARIIICDGA
jgi:uncharacterized protein (DUF1330 family)